MSQEADFCAPYLVHLRGPTEDQHLFKGRLSCPVPLFLYETRSKASGLRETAFHKGLLCMGEILNRDDLHFLGK